MDPLADNTSYTVPTGRLRVAWWPTWALACTVAAGAAGSDGRFIFDATASWLLAGVLFGLFVEHVLAISPDSRIAHSGDRRFYAPYMQPGSVADRLAQFASRQWASASRRYRGNASALETGAGAVLSAGTLLVVATFLGPGQTLTYALGIALVAPLALARPRAWAMNTAWPLGVQVGLSWAIGQVLTGSSPARAAISSLLVGLTIMGSANGPRGRLGIRWLGGMAWCAMSAIMLSQHQIWAALLGIALLLAFQCVAPQSEEGSLPQRDRIVRTALPMAMIMLFAFSSRSWGW